MKEWLVRQRQLESMQWLQIGLLAARSTVKYLDAGHPRRPSLMSKGSLLTRIIHSSHISTASRPRWIDAVQEIRRKY